MKVMHQFTLTHMKQNKKHTIFSILSIVIATLFLTTLMLFQYAMEQSQIENYINTSGEWHAEFRLPLTDKQVGYIRENPEVDVAMYKTDFYIQKPSGIEGRPYFAQSDISGTYGKEMRLEGMLVAGRMPEHEDELAVSEAFLAANPEWQLGDELTMIEGERQLEGEVIDQLDLWQEGETFKEGERNKSYRIVGVISENYEYSDSPFFLSIGYSDALLPDRGYVVYVRLSHIRDTYQVIPDMAHAIGLQADANGRYPILYNRYLLEKHAVFEAGLTLQFINTVIVFAIIGGVIIAFFVVIIYHAFAVSTGARIKHLGLLKSIGASPKQIHQSVRFEGWVLSLIGIPIGIVGGYVATGLILGMLNQSYEQLGMSDMMVRMHCNVWILLLIAIGTLMIVMISAYLPARKVAKMSPIKAIKQGGYEVKRRRASCLTRSLEKWFGVEGNLAMKSHQAHKKGFRAAFISLTLSFSILVGGMLFYNIYQFVYFDYVPPEQVTRADYEIKYRLSEVPEEKKQQLEDQVRQIEGVSTVQAVKTTLYVDYMAKEGEFSQEIRQRGLKPLQREFAIKDGSYELTAEIMTIEDEAFRNYCQRIGADPDKLMNLEGGPKAILYNNTLYDKKALISNQEYMPLVGWELPYQATFTERPSPWDESKVTQSFEIEVGYATDVPPDYMNAFDYYRLILVIPESALPTLLPRLGARNQELLGREMIYMDMPKDQVSEVKAKVETIYAEFLERENFYMWDILSVEQEQQSIISMMIKLAILGVSFISLIGIVNIYSTMSHQVLVRRREFAMLKSAGLSPGGLRKILFFECIFYSIRPVVYSVPLLAAFGIWMLYLARFSPWVLLKVFPYGVFVVGSLVMGSLIFGIAYGLAQSIQKEAIVDVIKDEAQ